MVSVEGWHGRFVVCGFHERLLKIQTLWSGRHFASCCFEHRWWNWHEKNRGFQPDIVWTAIRAGVRKTSLAKESRDLAKCCKTPRDAVFPATTSGSSMDFPFLHFFFSLAPRSFFFSRPERPSSATDHVTLCEATPGCHGEVEDGAAGGGERGKTM